MPGFKTAFQGYGVRFSPFEDSKIAVATSQNFGIIGNGRQYVLQARNAWEGVLIVWGCCMVPGALQDLGII